jgi:lipopolysaccharide biosynthesis regulator YciM
LPLELWIVLALVVVAAIGWVIARLRRKRRAEAPESGNNVYPLW